MSEPQSVAQALASLPEEERIILTMHFMKSMSAQEIATMLGVPERSVRALIISGNGRISLILGLK
jgi:RNA polymerase sigma factor (sigma-70 family)